MAHANKIVLISVVYRSFDNPNCLTTEQPDFGAYTLDWFSRLERRSTLFAEKAWVWAGVRYKYWAFLRLFALG